MMILKIWGFGSKTKGMVAICILNLKLPPLAQFESYKKTFKIFSPKNHFSLGLFFKF